MKAVVQRRYGPPEVLRVEEVEKPVPGDRDVLVRVHASTVSTSSAFMRRGEPRFARLFVGLTRPKSPVPGTDLAGVVEAVGKDVTRFRPGDRVFAASDAEFGAHAEWVCLAESTPMTAMPAGARFEEAAAISEGGGTALAFLRDVGRVGSGTGVLVNGASGAIGTAAVQLARHLGARVTGVCSADHVELVKSLGADEVIDYRREDFTRSGRTWDVIFDTVGKSSFPASRPALSGAGLYMCPVLSLPLLGQMLWTSRFGKKKAAFSATGLRPADAKQRDLEHLARLVEEGKLRVVIDRTYPLEQVVEAARYVDGGHKKGNVILMLPERDGA
jgi:NADPH:quinone reductase-like Zn-dependent oxidoreductase